MGNGETLIVEIGYRESIDEVIIYLEEIKKFDPTLAHLKLYLPDNLWHNEEVTTAFRKLNATENGEQ